MRRYDIVAAIFGFTLLAGCGSSSPSIGSSDAADADKAQVGPLGFTPSNIDLAKLDFKGIGDIDCTATGGISTSSTPGTLGCSEQTQRNFTVVTQSDGTKLGVWVARSWRIEPNVTLGLDGDEGADFPLVLVATETIDILGGLDGVPNGNGAVGGGFRGSSTGSGGGPGGGGAAGSNNAGGGGSYCGVGGTGGAEKGAANAPGGSSYGTAKLVPLTGGSSGGGDELCAGAGGGAIQLVAGVSVTIGAGASVNVGGGGGSFGSCGGGSGGALLIESPSVTVDGALAANGGAGGSCGNSGGNGLPSAKPAAGGSSTQSGPTVVGGSGSAGATTQGGDGQASTNPEFSCTAGGGGGAGRIRINTSAGKASVAGASLSPGDATPCLTQGTLP